MMNDLSRHSKADPLIHVVDELGIAVSALRTAWLALRNPETPDRYGMQYALEVLERATDRVANARDEADAVVHEIIQPQQILRKIEGGAV